MTLTLLALTLSLPAAMLLALAIHGGTLVGWVIAYCVIVAYLGVMWAICTDGGDR